MFARFVELKGLHFFPRHVRAENLVPEPAAVSVRAERPHQAPDVARAPRPGARVPRPGAVQHVAADGRVSGPGRVRGGAQLERVVGASQHLHPALPALVTSKDI